MSSINTTWQSSASVALRLLTDASARHSSPTNGIQPKSAVGTRNPASFNATCPSSDTRVILSAQTAIDYFGPGSDVAKAASLGDTVEVQTSGLDVPGDKAAFRQQVLDFLKRDAAGYDARDPEQAEFMQALKAGKVIVQTVDETPELNWQPQVDYTIYKDGYSQGGGGGTPWIGNYTQYEAQSATRGQASGSIGSQVYYAYFSK